MSWGNRLKQALLGLVGKSLPTQEDWEHVSTLLLQADLGPFFTNRILNSLPELLRGENVRTKLLEQIRLMLAEELEYPFFLNEAGSPPFVYLFLGVNGSGKTTTVAKMANFLQSIGRESLLVCADTFRPAAREQLQIWAERLKLPFLGHQIGSDPSAVVFDAIEMAQIRKINTVLIDTAGRQHTMHNLMEELKKLKRVISKKLPDAPQECFLVLDTNAGLNALSQARSFQEALGLSGIILSKFDSPAKGGFILLIRQELGLPVKFLGVGERVEDFLPFQSELFLQKFFS